MDRRHESKTIRTTAMRQDAHRPGFMSIAVSISTLIVIGTIAILLSTAIEAGGWTLIAFLLFVVAAVGVCAWLVSFFVRQYVKWTEARTKAQDQHNNFVLNLVRIGYLPDGRGGVKPIHEQQIAAPKQKEVAPADPRKQLLIELCLMTIRSDKRDDKTGELIYGPASKRLMTADDAQAASKARGGAFADRTAWDKASKYAQENFLVHEQRGGKEQGMMVDHMRAGGNTIADLMSVLMRNPILDEAVNALPGVER